MNGNADKLWMTELETIFGLPINYTAAANISITKRQRLLGKAWSVHVVKHILQPLKLYFECESTVSEKADKINCYRKKQFVRTNVRNKRNCIIKLVRRRSVNVAVPIYS